MKKQSQIYIYNIQFWQQIAMEIWEPSDIVSDIILLIIISKKLYKNTYNII